MGCTSRLKKLASKREENHYLKQLPAVILKSRLLDLFGLRSFLSFRDKRPNHDTKEKD